MALQPTPTLRYPAGMPETAPSPLRAQELAQQQLLHGVALESVWSLLSACPVRSLEPGTCVLKAGTPNHSLFLVLSGRLDVRLEGQDENERIGSIDAGQAVGEVSVIDAGPASAHVFAAVPTRLLEIEETAFWRLIEVSHDLAVNLLLQLTERLRANNTHISEATRQKRVFERAAQVDGLTNLFNRRWLNEQLPRLVQRHERGGEPFSLLVLDIDHFKRFNDHYGHAAGDQVLVTVARTIQQCVRPTDLSARLGGEELVILLPRTPLIGARVAAARLHSAIAATSAQTPEGQTLPSITVSIGIASLTVGESADALLARADAHLYEAKRDGRNRSAG